MNKLITINYQIGEGWGELEFFAIVDISNRNVVGRHTLRR